MKKVKLVVLAVSAIMCTQLMANHFATSTTKETTKKEIVTDEYSEIDASTLPKLVIEAVQKDFEGATIEQAFVNEEGNYKLVLNKESKSHTVFAKASGEWITEVTE